MWLLCTLSLQDYLESKRLAFPRLYFISNNELLDMLAHIKEPAAIQVMSTYSPANNADHEHSELAGSVVSNLRCIYNINVVQCSVRGFSVWDLWLGHALVSCNVKYNVRNNYDAVLCVMLRSL